MKRLAILAAALVASAGCGQHSGNLWKGIFCRTAALERPGRVFRPPEGERRERRKNAREALNSVIFARSGSMGGP